MFEGKCKRWIQLRIEPCTSRLRYAQTGRLAVSSDDLPSWFPMDHQGDTQEFGFVANPKMVISLARGKSGPAEGLGSSMSGPEMSDLEEAGGYLP